VTDLTYVPTWAGIAYVCFIIDACSRMSGGWRVASHMRTDTVLDALDRQCQEARPTTTASAAAPATAPLELRRAGIVHV